ncbi:response regulator [Calothrix sp. PCC 7507]|uniref:response regulator n=1 Tax=Calothrix sp. PCC 7507 TaxID=99598 RepID=UPI00029F4212|nr:response regulator [Calothrix sp. PCC 7507]AFY31958.1 response regulator receiver protein [Calothrix sp. PCC 7507]
MNIAGTFTKLSPQSLLRQLSGSSDSTCLRTLSNSVSWSIYLEQGKITYATHSVEPFDRLERHLRRLSHQVPLLTSETRVQLRLMFEPDSQSQFPEQHNDTGDQPPEYQAIYWLVSQQHLHSTQAAVLIQELVKEVIESFLLINAGIYELSDSLERVPRICRLDVEKILERCETRLQSWQSLAPQISSPYQRPHLLINSPLHKKNLPDLQPSLTNWMKGFSLRHLAVIMNQDEIQLARNLSPYILKGGIILHEPDPPFDKLPKTFDESSASPNYITELVERELIAAVVKPSSIAARTYPEISVENIATVQRLPQISVPPTDKVQELTIPNNINHLPERVTTATVTAKKTYKIVSVDDSPTILKEISRFLEDENFSVVTINEPLKAVMSIIRHKPDLILLDLNMAGIDGYELCRIVRNNSMFKNTPIIFVTGNKGLVDKVKARLVGASGYLTKPFTRAELLKIVFMHLA